MWLALFLLTRRPRDLIMNIGYILFCSKTSFGQCLSRRLYTCSDEHVDDVKRIPKGAVLFMYDSGNNILVGPFTAASEGALRIETGTWLSKVDEHSASENIKLEWENLHIIKDAVVRFPFLKSLKKCEISSLWTQTVLDALERAPSFNG